LTNGASSFAPRGTSDLLRAPGIRGIEAAVREPLVCIRIGFAGSASARRCVRTAVGWSTRFGGFSSGIRCRAACACVRTRASSIRGARRRATGLDARRSWCATELGDVPLEPTLAPFVVALPPHATTASATHPANHCR
jgi:hypothetical protein